MVMERIPFILWVLILLDASALPQAKKSLDSAQDIPAPPGVYCHQGEAGWVRLERAKMENTKTRGMERFLDTDGLSGLNVTITYPGAQSATQLSSRRPVFHVQRIGSVQDVVIVQLTRNKDSRQAQTSLSDAGIGNKEGFRRGEIHRVTVEGLTEDHFTITPVESLRPGEYLLVLGHVDTAFDFGIKPAKR